MTKSASRAALALLAVIYGGAVLSHASRAVGGSDSSGYLNAAKAIASGHPVETIDALERLRFPAERAPLFVPLGYVLGPRPGTMTPLYPVGLPLHAVLFGFLFGWSTGPFLVNPLAGVASILLIFAIARELEVSRAGALACAGMLAVLPVLTFHAVQLMSDVLACAWALATILFALKSRRRPAWAAAAGLAFGIGVLVRPTAVILLFPLLFAIPSRVRSWALFLAGGIPALAVFLGFNELLYGGPLKTGYGEGGTLSGFAFENFPPRARHYGYWVCAMTTPLVPAAWLALAADRRRPARVRLLLLSWFGAFFLLFSVWGAYDAWWYTRFLLSGIPALFVGAAMVAEDALRFARARGERSGRRASAILLAAAFAFVIFTGFRLGRRFEVLVVAKGQDVFPESIRWASARVPANSIVLAVEFSGAMKAYGWGTFLRWDWIDTGDFPPLRAKIEAAGYRIYALLFPQEVRDAAPRLPGTRWKYLGSNRDASLWELEPRL